MRTNTGRLGQSLKKLAMILMVATLSVACGKNNTSGKSSNGSGGGGVAFGPGVDGYNYYNGPLLQPLLQESICSTGHQTRLQDVSAVQTQVGPGYYAGVTSEGDVAFINNGVLELHMCHRPDLTGNGQVVVKPKVNDSKDCAIDEITQMDVILEGRYGNYTLRFRSLSFGVSTGKPGWLRPSNQCNNYWQHGHYYP